MAGAAAATAPALASTATASHPHSLVSQPGGPMRLAGHATVSNDTVTSSNWSGYAVHSSTYTSISGSWTEPTVNCSAAAAPAGATETSDSSEWVGIDGFSDTTVEQEGTEAGCSGTTAFYDAWYEIFPASEVVINKPVKPGDHFHATTTNVSPGHYKLAIADTTQHWTFSITKPLSSAKNSSAEAIIEAPENNGQLLMLSDFGTVHFTGVTVDGQAIGSMSPTRIIMENSTTHQRNDTVSGLTKQKAFTATWLSGQTGG